jgi:transporter family-2 protein
MTTVYLALAAAIGAGLAVQAGINNHLRSAVGSPLWAAIISATLTVLLLGSAQLTVRDPLSLARAAGYPWWIWAGGTIGAAYVFGIVALTRHLGVAALFVAIVAGQLVAGLVIDHYGLFNVPVQRINWGRLGGVLLLVAGMVLIRSR